MGCMPFSGSRGANEDSARAPMAACAGRIAVANLESIWANIVVSHYSSLFARQSAYISLSIELSNRKSHTKSRKERGEREGTRTLYILLSLLAPPLLEVLSLERQGSTAQY